QTCALPICSGVLVPGAGTVLPGPALVTPDSAVVVSPSASAEPGTVAAGVAVVDAPVAVAGCLPVGPAPVAAGGGPAVGAVLEGVVPGEEGDAAADLAAGEGLAPASDGEACVGVGAGFMEAELEPAPREPAAAGSPARVRRSEGDDDVPGAEPSPAWRARMTTPPGGGTTIRSTLEIDRNSFGSAG